MSAPSQMPVDIGSFLDADPDLMLQVAKSIHSEYAAKCALAEKWTRDQLSAAAKIEYQAREGWAEEYVAEIPQEAYFYWAQRLGKDCWSDTQFLQEFLRDNPQCRRKTITNRTVITNPGLPWKKVIGAASEAAGWEGGKAA